MDMNFLCQRYLEFQKEVHSPFHVVTYTEQELTSIGFHKLSLKQNWNLEINQGYFVVHEDGKSILAFVTSKDCPTKHGFAVFGAHTDSPTLKLRLNPWQSISGYTKLSTELHGSLIQRSFLDRPLVLGGMVYSFIREQEDEISFETSSKLPNLRKRLVKSSKPIAVIPDLAIHLDRDKNSSGSINPEVVLSAIVGTRKDLPSLMEALKEILGVEGEMDGFDLCFSPYWPHCLTGLDDSMIVGPRHDDLAMLFAGLEAISELVKRKAHVEKTPVVAFFDAEETGSATSSGAGSFFIRHVLEKMMRSHPQYKEGELSKALHQSFLVSADMAHGLHPNFPQKHDDSNRPVINGGLVIKHNANDRYCTSGFTATVFKGLCEKADVPVQYFVSRQDMGCGSTIGPILSSALSCQGVDVGTAMWAMHSSAETMGVIDLYYAWKVFFLFLGGNTL